MAFRYLDKYVSPQLTSFRVKNRFLSWIGQILRVKITEWCFKLTRDDGAVAGDEQWQGLVLVLFR